MLLRTTATTTLETTEIERTKKPLSTKPFFDDDAKAKNERINLNLACSACPRLTKLELYYK